MREVVEVEETREEVELEVTLSPEAAPWLGCDGWAIWNEQQKKDGCSGRIAMHWTHACLRYGEMDKDANRRCT